MAGSARCGRACQGQAPIGSDARAIRCLSSPLPQLQDETFTETAGTGFVGGVVGRGDLELHAPGQKVGGVLNAVRSAQIHSAAGDDLEHHVPITVVPRCFVQVVPSECELIERHCRAGTQIRRKVAQPTHISVGVREFHCDIDAYGYGR